MASVSVNPPKTPVTKGSSGVAMATVPNVCKMPGSPFIPSPLPNIGKSGSSPKKYTKDVTVEKKSVAVRGASFESQGDMASKGTGGGLISANTHGPTKFIGPGSLDVKFEGKNVHLLGDPMMNNCGSSGSPANSATLAGVAQIGQIIADAEAAARKACCECDEEVQPGPLDSCKSLGEKKHACCEEKLTHQKNVGGERGYHKDGTPFTNGPRSRMPGEKYGDFCRRISGCAFPDACALDGAGNPLKFFDFKFGCPPGVPTHVKKDGTRGPLSKGLSRPGIGDKQRAKYSNLAKTLGVPDTQPKSISNRDCP